MKRFISMLLVVVLLLTGCGANNKVELRFVTSDITDNVQYIQAYYAYEENGVDDNDLPAQDEESTELFNQILQEEFDYLQNRFGLKDFEVTEVPVLVLSSQECEKVLNYTADQVDAMEAAYNAHYKKVFMSDTYFKNVSRNVLIGVYAHEAIHAIFQEYNKTDLSVFCLQSNNEALGYYLSEGFTQDLSNDFLSECYPEAKKVRTDAYNFAGYITDLLEETLGAETYYLNNDVTGFEDAFNKAVYSNTSSLKRADKYSALEVFLYAVDFSTYYQLYATSQDEFEDALPLELAAWELAFVTGRGTSNVDGLINIYRTYDKKLWKGAYTESYTMDDYFESILSVN